MKYAIIETGGKQYKVLEGQKVQVELIGEAKEGQAIEFTNVLAIGGEEPKVGTPLLDSAKVVGEVLSHGRQKKVIVFKKKRRKGYSKSYGHKQHYTEVLIKEIAA
ncbi:MAG: 50S ribosomal protein L21 [Deltaproteobacteria bacterium]|nr:50S ribosomal protein L21 [Deltaproteobacteria bacterium]